ncbi:hypothetical protein PR202_ga11429 [Eleusine coracana subsp. coracana]|uniref:Uncharacterized protein n=1 Tax=Eleusine coracana subsp. coracana TaxID=191504 RepID=A0AAV5C9K1_ELECO|nr:hypothetical protein PR202_ga11429 [Eleusine coracana subsp. coracana]
MLVVGRGDVLRKIQAPPALIQQARRQPCLWSPSGKIEPDLGDAKARTAGRGGSRGPRREWSVPVRRWRARAAWERRRAGPVAEGGRRRGSVGRKREEEERERKEKREK